MNILPLCRPRMTKSESPAASALVPETVPSTMDRIGTLPEQDTSRSRISPLAPSDVTPSWGRCPSPSHIPITGSRPFSASSRILQIFLACISPMVPENTAKSCEKHTTLLPSSMPCPATTPSPSGLCRCMPWSPDLCFTNASNSTKLPSSSRSKILSLAVLEPDSLISLITPLSPGDLESRLIASRSSLGP